MKLTPQIMTQFIRVLALIVTGGHSFVTLAAAGDMTFTGTLIDAPACTINQGVDPYVDFGKDILTTKVDGVNYAKEANYTIDCTNNVNNSLRMQLYGLATDFDTKAIKTTNVDIGIALYIGNIRTGVNEWFNFTYPTKPVIKLIPIKRPNIILKGGTFSGYVEFKVDYL
jgi:hypothetical protein